MNHIILISFSISTSNDLLKVRDDGCRVLAYYVIGITLNNTLTTQSASAQTIKLL